MKKLLSVKYAPGAFNAAMFMLRVGMGVLIMHHGYLKLIHFSSMENEFTSFMGLGNKASLCLSIFAEFFCGLFVVLGLFTRLVVIPLIINMSVALVLGHHGDVFGKGELSALFLTGFIVLLFVGPGRASVDGIAGK